MRSSAAMAAGAPAGSGCYVVSTNERAIKTWEAYGFAKVGRLPLSFRHLALGYCGCLRDVQATLIRPVRNRQKVCSR